MKKNTLLDWHSKPTTLQAGDLIGLDTKNNLLMLRRGIYQLRWPAGNEHGDSKAIAGFPLDERNFIYFATILAATHGMRARLVSPWVCGPACEFVEG